MTHDHFLKKKGSTNKVDKQEHGELKPLLFGILCITGYPVHVAQKCIWHDELTIFHCMFSLHCIWIPVYLVRGVGRLHPGPILTLLHTGFERKGTPFIYFLLTNGTPFTYLV